MKIICKIIKQKIQDNLPLRFWQVVGLMGIIAAYIIFVIVSRQQGQQPRYQALWGWAVLAVVVGIPEAIVIYIYDNTITRFVRNIVGTTLDRIFLFGLVIVTWILAGELAAGFFAMGLLNSHFHEHE